ncbi:hypothetical protein [Lysinibacillus sp. RC79]|uniref:hypothetical protein n=1 Tax=Lysinibacillus sp. RC79 TaxID=3156296 RepID=UPI0035138414
MQMFFARKRSGAISGFCGVPCLVSGVILCFGGVRPLVSGETHTFSGEYQYKLDNCFLYESAALTKRQQQYFSLRKRSDSDNKIGGTARCSKMPIVDKISRTDDSIKNRTHRKASNLVIKYWLDEVFVFLR